LLDGTDSPAGSTPTASFTQRDRDFSKSISLDRGLKAGSRLAEKVLILLDYP
jgi:hypothetical protein